MTDSPSTKPALPSAKPEIDEEELFRGDLTPLITTFALGARTVARCVTRVEVEGDFDAIPREGPVILASNHISNADPVILGAWFTPRLGRRIHWLGKKEMFDLARRRLDGPQWRRRPGRSRRRRRRGLPPRGARAGRRPRAGGLPEGTRSPTGELQVPKDGLAMLALRTNATIVPIGISNTDRVWKKGSRLPRPGGHATMRIGEPFRLADVLPAGTDRKSRKSTATDVIMRRIAALLDERHRGPYGDPEEAAAT
jgi:1-acyl-sn-glycerol-3-phosphate acyltransferase